MAGAAGKTIKDMVNAKDAMLISFGMGFVYSLIFLYLMSAFAEPIAWLCVFLIQVGLFGAAAGSFFVYTDLHKKAGMKDLNTAEIKKTNEEATGALVGAIVMGLIACCFLCCVVCGRKHLALAIDVIDASADFTAENKRVIFVPIVYFFISLIFLIIWIGAMATVASLNEIKPGNYAEIPQDKDIIWTSKTRYMGLFMLFGILWILAFIDYTSKFIVMAAAATYYFDSNAEKDGTADLSYAIKIAHLNHAGSIAFGSFIIAVVQFIELVFMYFAKKAEQAGGDNQVIKLVVCIGECVLKCIEKIVDYIN
jgi:choline transporter-like protein 2/4/5